ncbi:hypothetical protein CJD36_021360 [Flavipsychrobacter stenotrophus]|uniref:Uncharacterized protein n=1 Tax=Flavipsychrobacter stenotrophus TaxID=2077091 RepID=A0A2S7SPZ4_9BACT|nr:hypothetical protein CJD36_021360 [Flavipsychrobacter stenotrophus]
MSPCGAKAVKRSAIDFMQPYRLHTRLNNKVAFPSFAGSWHGSHRTTYTHSPPPLLTALVAAFTDYNIVT